MPDKYRATGKSGKTYDAVAMSQAEWEKLMSERVDLIAKNTHLEEENKKLDGWYSNACARHMAAVKENKRLKQENERSDYRMQLAQHARDMRIEQCAQLTTQVEQLRQENAVLIKANAKPKHWREPADGWIRDMCIEINAKLEQENAGQKAALESATMKLAECAGERDGLKEQLQGVADARVQEVTQLRTQNERLKRSVGRLVSELVELRKADSKLIQTVAGLQIELDNVHASRNDIRVQNEQLKNDNKVCQRCETFLKDLKALRKQYRLLQVKHGGLQIERDNTHASYNDIRTQNEQLKKDAKRYRDWYDTERGRVVYLERVIEQLRTKDKCATYMFTIGDYTFFRDADGLVDEEHS